VIVPIPEAIYDGLARIARRREASKGSRVGKDQCATDREGWKLHLLGLLGEWAVAKALGSEIDLQILERAGDGHEGDIVLANGETVQVKTTKQRGWAFRTLDAEGSDFRDHYGVLVWPLTPGLRTTGPGVQIIGWLTRDQFFRFAQIDDYGYGPRLVCEAAYFNPDMAELDRCGRRFNQRRR
jgi:hypothetical protein